jgi:RNA polymerase sigma-70 factor (ECF subfamily)
MENDPPSPSDEEIVRRVLAGEVNAFEYLVRRYQRLVLATVKKHAPFDCVEDIVQDVYLRAYRSLPGFRRTDRFAHWLSVIAVRACYDFWRQRYKSRELPMSSLAEEHVAHLEAAASDEGAPCDEKALQREAREALDWALGKLSAGDRMVLELVYLEGRSVKEAAGLLGWSVANVKVRLFRSRRKLRGLLEPET